MVVCRRTGRGEIDTPRKILATSLLSLALMVAPAGAAVHRHPCRDAPAGHPLRLDQRPAGPDRRRRRPPADRVRTLPAARPHAPRGGHDARDRGRPWLRHDRQPRQLPDPAGAAAGAPRPAARRPARDRAVGRARLPGAAQDGQGLRAPRGRVRARARARRDFYGTHAAVDDVAAVLDALRHRTRRPLRRLLRDVRGPGLRRAPRRPAALAGARRRLPGRPAPTRPSATSPRRRSARCGWCASARPTCAARGEDPIAVVGRLVERVRAHPLSGFGVDADGNRVRVRLNEPAVAALIQSGYANVPMYRDLLAAIPRLRGRRPRPAAAAVRGEQARHGRLPRARLLRGPLPRGHLPRLPAAVGSRRARPPPAASSSRATSRRCRPPRSRRSRPRSGPASTTRARSPASTGRAAARPTRRCRPAPPTPPCRRWCSTATSTTSPPPPRADGRPVARQIA